LYRASYLAGAGLVVAALAQAFAPDHLDGVAHASISNPYGQSWLRRAVGYATFAGVAVLGIFSVGVAIDVIRRAVRAEGAAASPIDAGRGHPCAGRRGAGGRRRGW
jgi:hypothetical protein